MENKLHEGQTMEKIIPAIALNEKNKVKLAGLVTKRFDELSGGWETEYAKRNRAISLMQKMLIFGSHWWQTQQVFKVDPEKVSLPDAPKEMMKINPKDDVGRYFLCVDLTGIRFCTQDSKKPFDRHIPIQNLAVEKVLKCGGKEDIVQIVVSMVDKEKATRVARQIAIKTPAALDVTYQVRNVMGRERELAKSVRKQRTFSDRRVMSMSFCTSMGMTLKDMALARPSARPKLGADL
mmetsp:Transcript_96214/g.271943  ORF Transcript_96214/g.271943 Transcript_96214/m.271943 type:complete len:236 (+) Transcript_96214:1-708(+)